MGKLWDKGQKLDPLIEEFTVGNDFLLDDRLVPYDVEGSKAHASMLAAIGILDAEELEKVLGGLDAVLAAWEAGEFVIEPSDEDVHTALERFLTERLGPLGGKIHTGRSRNDQVLCDLWLWQRDAARSLAEQLGELLEAFERFAVSNEGLAMPGYTHLQRAMPSTADRWARAYHSVLSRNLILLGAADSMAASSPLGSAAGYGVPDSLGIDRKATQEALNFDEVLEPAEAAQLLRGKVEATLAFACAQIATDLGRWAWDLCLYCTEEFGLMKLPDSMTTGSSIMPQKRNPDVLELCRARAATVRAAAQEILAIAGPLPSGYHRDMQQTKEPLFRAHDTCQGMLAVATHVMEGVEVDRERCEAAMSEELFATEEALRLVREGMPFREAYRTVGARFVDSESD